jgi:signal peptidase
MPSSRTDDRFRWPRRVAEWLLAGMMVAAGWTHGFVYVEGASMQPALTPGDLLVYRRHQPRLEHGELVVFEHEGSLVVHRVVGVFRDGSLRTKGDANERLDADPIAEDAVRGEVVLVIPCGSAAARLAALGH